MKRSNHPHRAWVPGSIWGRPSRLALLMGAGIGLMTAVASFADLPGGSATEAQVLRGRQLVIEHDCDGCHNSGNPGAVHDPTDPKWLSGLAPGGLPFVELGKHKTRPRNLTPDNLTGMGRISALRIFNALRYGLKPGDTPEMVITGSVPGEGNFPAIPKYLAPPMPWPYFRHMTDAELWGVVAYLKYGVKPVRHGVRDSDGPPDFWAGFYASQPFGPYPAPAYPTVREVLH